MKWYKTYILTTAKFEPLEPMMAQCNVQALAQKNAPGRIAKVPDLENQKDLMKMVSILLSTGINRNDDVFLPSEVLPVRNTGAHKPVNLEHDPTKIVGHIIRTFATEKAGKRVLDGKKPKGKQFNITAESVLYSFLFKGLAKEVRERADSDSLFVSVEVWFTEFDFLVGNKIVKRTSETASVLEPKLKASGGPGFFEGQKLGRVLRNMILGGMGIVRDPANPESIVKSVSGFNSEVVQEIEDDTISSQVLGDIQDQAATEIEHDNDVEVVITEESMNPELIEEMAAVAAACEAASENTEIVEDVLPVEGEQVEEQATASAGALKDDPMFKALATRLAVVEAENKDNKAARKDAEFKAECSRRETELRKLGFEDEDALSAILTSRSMFSMTEEQFNQYVGLLTQGLNAIGTQQATASTETAEETTEVEAQESETTEEVTAETETQETETETTEETTEEGVDGEAGKTGEGETTEIEDEIEVEIEAVDPDINTKTGSDDAEPSLVDRMADVASIFLKQKDPKWANLALKK